MGERGKQFVDVGLGNVAEESCRLSLQLSHAPDRDVKFDGLRNQRAGCRPDKCWSVRVSKLSRAVRYGTLKPRHTPRYQEHRTHSIEEAGRAGGAVVRQPDVCPGGGGRCGWALGVQSLFSRTERRGIHRARNNFIHSLPLLHPTHLPPASFSPRLNPLVCHAPLRRPTPAANTCTPGPVPRPSSLLLPRPPRQRAQQESSRPPPSAGLVYFPAIELLHHHHHPQPSTSR